MAQKKGDNALINDHEWHDYDPSGGYDKEFFDIETHDGRIFQHVYPNAGKWDCLRSSPRVILKDTEIKRYRVQRPSEWHNQH